MWPAIIGAAGSLGAGLLGGYMHMSAQEAANQANLEATRHQMYYQDRWFQQAKEMNWQQYFGTQRYNTDMANTAYQRGVADMKAAGLNPMLAYQQGGASSPVGSNTGSPSTPSGASPDIRAASMGDSLSRGVASAMDALRLKREFEQTDSAIKLNEAAERTQNTQAELNLSSAKSADANTIKAKADAYYSLQSGKKAELDAAALAKRMGAIEAQAKLDETTLKNDLDMSTVDKYLKRIPVIGSSARDISNAVK